jgi:hypothetical protein
VDGTTRMIVSDVLAILSSSANSFVFNYQSDISTALTAQE